VCALRSVFTVFIEITGKFQDHTATIICTWAQDERPADLHMAQPNVPVSKTGQFPPAKLVRGGRAMQGDHTLATIGKLVVSI
jgi:hypothetical protein